MLDVVQHAILLHHSPVQRVASLDLLLCQPSHVGRDRLLKGAERILYDRSEVVHGFAQRVKASDHHFARPAVLPYVRELKIRLAHPDHTSQIIQNGSGIGKIAGGRRKRGERVRPAVETAIILACCAG